MDAEIHIAGILIHARADHLDRTVAAIGAWPETDVRAVGAEGKLVVVSECGSADGTLELISRMRDLPGVLNVALVYQHAENAGALNEEIDNESDAPRLH